MFVIEQPLLVAPAADSAANVLAEWNAHYNAYNEMKGYVDQLEHLGYMIPQNIIVGLILNGLTKDFAGFARNYNMHNIRNTIGELYAMLIEYEKGLPKKVETPQVMMIKGGKIQKANKKSLKAKGKGKAKGTGKDKQVYTPKPKNRKPSAKEHPTKDDTYHHCKEAGHWKRNCPVYLAELVKKHKQVGFASSSGIFTIELFAFPNKSWVYDTGCGTHICITKQRFREARKLKQGALYLYVGNDVRAQVEEIRSFDLVFPNDLVICLDNYHYAPSITRCVVSVHRLVENEFVQCFMDFGISVSKNNVFYFNAIPSDGIYEIDMHDLVPNDNSIYNVSTKRAKHNLDSTYLWHCHLAHIKRATDLFGIIHIDVCGPLRHVSRQDRGGKYISQEFKDYLKACGIVRQLTPPYTPQHNGVSEKRNRTVRHGSIYNKSYNSAVILLGLALESATRILDMVPTKKVDKTPYELWYGKVPNLSYLKVRGCEALVKRDTPDKLQQRSVKCIFIGYPKEKMGYYFYFPPENKIVVVRYAEFFEKNLITQKVSGRAIDLKDIQDEDTSPYEITSEISMEVEEVEEYSLGDLNEHASYKAAMLDLESNKWIDAMNAEIQSMIDNMVWVLVDLPLGCNTVGSKCIFKKKTDMDGIVHTYKARLVAKGYTQLYEVDYEETSIYGLKQASRSSNKRFNEELKKFGFAQNLDESCVYQKASRSNITFLILYVDDIIIMENHIPSLQSVKDYLGKYFAMKDLGEAEFILGIKIYRDRSKRLIRLGQNDYMDKILKRYKMDNSKRGHIPMQERLDLNKIQGALSPKEVKCMQNVPYALDVGSIMYVVRCIRPDVAFAKNITNRFNKILVNFTGLL
nr:hypothetical protein [Tanacetum cinerariifolium]